MFQSRRRQGEEKEERTFLSIRQLVRSSPLFLNSNKHSQQLIALSVVAKNDDYLVCMQDFHARSGASGVDLIVSLASNDFSLSVIQYLILCNFSTERQHSKSAGVMS